MPGRLPSAPGRRVTKGVWHRTAVSRLHPDASRRPTGKLKQSRKMIVGSLLLLCAFSMLLTNCSSGDGSALPTDPSSPRAPGTADTVEHPFRLVLDLPSTTWAHGESIEGRARLELVEGTSVEIGRSGSGVIGFGFKEVDGRRELTPMFTADCSPGRIDAAHPAVEDLTKSPSGYSAQDPEADFYRDFFERPGIVLPPGEWDITAVANFTERFDCGGSKHWLRATVRITVIP
jgi:hypothetical protein